jgi:transposase
VVRCALDQRSEGLLNGFAGLRGPNRSKNGRAIRTPLCASAAEILAEVGFYREVRVKGCDSMLTRTLVAARTRLVRITVELSNQIRGLMKTFGLVVPASEGDKFEANVRRLLADHDGLQAVILPVLEAWRGLRVRASELGRQLLAGARRSRVVRGHCRRIILRKDLSNSGWFR